MPRFLVRRAGGRAQVTRDGTGLDLESLDAAEAEAIRGAAEISCESLPRGRASETMVQVRGERGKHIIIVALSMKVPRVDLTRA